MMGILYFFLFIIFIVVLLGAGLIGGVLRFLFGSKSRSATSGSSGQGEQQRSTSRWYVNNRKKKKVFSDTEGEYVDFEEIKDHTDEEKKE